MGVGQASGVLLLPGFGSAAAARSFLGTQPPPNLHCLWIELFYEERRSTPDFQNKQGFPLITRSCSRYMSM